MYVILFHSAGAVSNRRSNDIEDIGFTDTKIGGGIRMSAAAFSSDGLFNGRSTAFILRYRSPNH